MITPTSSTQKSDMKIQPAVPIPPFHPFIIASLLFVVDARRLGRVPQGEARAAVKIRSSLGR